MNDGKGDILQDFELFKQSHLLPLQRPSEMNMYLYTSIYSVASKIALLFGGIISLGENIRVVY